MNKLIKGLCVLCLAALGCAGASHKATAPVDPTCKTGSDAEQAACLRHKLDVVGGDSLARIESQRSEQHVSVTTTSSPTASPPATTSAPVPQPAAQPAASPSLLPTLVAPPARPVVPLIGMMQNRKVCFPDNPRNGCDDTFNIDFQIYYAPRLWEVKSRAIMPSDRDAMNVLLSQSPSDPSAPGIAAGHLVYLWAEQANGVRTRKLFIPPGMPAKGYYYFDSTNGGSGLQSYDLVAYEASSSCGWSREFPCKATRERVHGSVTTPFQDNWFEVKVTAQHVVNDRGSY